MSDVQYEWEEDAVEMINHLMEIINKDKKYAKSYFLIRGIGIEHCYEAEGAYISTEENSGDVAVSDVTRDIAYDAQKAYEETCSNRALNY